MASIKILYAGDSDLGGAANYLYGVLRTLKADITHIPPSKPIAASRLKSKYDVILLSDYPKQQLSASSETALVKQVEEGAGFMMIGGWGSFSGPFGGWRGSLIEKILPVQCLHKDDRTNFPSGAHIALERENSIFRGMSFEDPPAICGMNFTQPKKGSLTVLTAKQILIDQKQAALSYAPRLYPLLVIDANPEKRIAAFSTDFAPHWCGGFVDWGTRHHRLVVTERIQIEVGNSYIRFIQLLIRWLARRI